MNFNLDWDRSAIDSKVFSRSQAQKKKPIVVTNIWISAENQDSESEEHVEERDFFWFDMQPRIADRKGSRNWKYDQEHERERRISNSINYTDWSIMINCYPTLESLQNTIREYYDEKLEDALEMLLLEGSKD